MFIYLRVESHASAVSLLNSGEQRYIKAKKAISNVAETSDRRKGALFRPHKYHLEVNLVQGAA